MKVLNLEAKDYSQKAKSIWQENNIDYSETTWESLFRNDVVRPEEIIIVRLERFIGENELWYFPNLKYIVSATTGWDHLDVELFKQKNIQLFSLRGHTEFLRTIPSTAEHTWALLLALLRNVVPSYKSVLEGSWDRDSHKGFQLFNKTIGILGLGRIGSMVAKYATSFGMNVIYYDPNVTTVEYKKANNLDSFINQIDILSIHVHLTDLTEGMIHQGLFSKEKPIYIVNTSRGKVVNETHIIEGIEKGTVLGYATDVLATEIEGEISANELVSNSKDKNILITPHIGGATYDAMWSTEEFVAQNTISSLKL